MVIQVYVEEIPKDVNLGQDEMADQDMSKPNLNIRLKNTDTLDEYRG